MAVADGAAGLDLLPVARALAPTRERAAAVARIAAGAGVELDEDFGRRTAAYYDAAPEPGYGADLRRRYDRLKRHNLAQFRALTDAGVEIRPWLGDGRPYPNSRVLRDRVRRTRRLYVHLTARGHGPGPVRGFHPMREPAGLRVDGVEFCHNDVFRAVHDLLGHVAFDTGFGPKGEFLAAHGHLQLYPEEAHPVLFTEQIAQICWFYYGPHRDVPASRRPFPEQKVLLFPKRFLDSFRQMFRPRPGEESG
ncbi:crotonobetainyl-CoA--carnitine CoA-transferase [Actinomadura geliboluensis]|uniref:crotonobetainyl-CoA--carnitine CoA-transferase n=1 Tax=Actinomadura geliboluensis TaxID=882440 RepID=UPI002626FD1D|nr:crotonobetainyl-CoA--carnitine CoA-transferase [Actinomadura geliboluensis]